MSRRRWRQTALLMFLTLLVLNACRGTGCNGGSTAADTGTTGEVASTGSGAVLVPVRTAPIANEGPNNGLKPAAICNNSDLFDLLQTSALDQRTIDSVPAAKMADVNTRGLLKYIVSCALDPGVSIDSHQTGKFGGTWIGEMGLCGQHSPWPWTSRPNVDCQEIVSSCVIARANRDDRRVLISVRGESQLSAAGVDVLFPMASEIPVQEHYRNAPDDLIPSVRAGWKVRDVGICETGASVTLTATQPSDTVRVCKGIYGCDNPPDPAQTYYVDFIDERAGTVTFSCPNNGPTMNGTPMGYYGVMVRSESGTAGDVNRITGKYPAREEDVFTFREGAFYGNIFDTKGRRGSLCTDRSPPGGDVFACYSDIWSAGLAHINDRWCARDENCFDRPTAPCLSAYDTNNMLVVVTERACKAQTAGPEPLYQLGRNLAPGAGNTGVAVGDYHWKHPITVYLNGPCDLQSGTDDACHLAAALEKANINFHTVKAAPAASK